MRVVAYKFNWLVMPGVNTLFKIVPGDEYGFLLKKIRRILEIRQID